MALTYVDFVNLREPELGEITSDLVSDPKNAERIAKAFQTWLSLWREEAWIDFERIELNLRDLRRGGLWEALPLDKFLIGLGEDVCESVKNAIQCFIDAEGC